jgi:hypothetical protein
MSGKLWSRIWEVFWSDLRWEQVRKGQVPLRWQCPEGMGEAWEDIGSSNGLRCYKITTMQGEVMHNGIPSKYLLSF